ncbi:lamina-associated polypeptide 2, isoforms beta/delta/epsilon/gamma-like isoform X1 [Anguilla rostrata]|uniref:lamina-associated polypeptide 2, isoforms beta/delta/epsilon/gamma-like isoform X1 n=1 Tax=Anguilla rostrata TaxID=7938 RepID=UPI0030D14BE0
MSEFLEDPSVLTKEKLKSELLANNVALPSGDQRKDVYVQLYLKTLTLQNKEISQATDTFSSDEDLPPAVVTNSSRSGKKATRKTDKPPPDDLSIADLPDQSLKEQLEKYGVSAGPVVASTRKLYEKKLQKLLEQGPPEAPAVASSRLNGNTDSDQYSDKEEDERVVPGLKSAPEAEAEPLPVVSRPGGSRGKTSVQSKTSHHQDHNQVVERVTAGDETPSMNGDDVLKELFPNEASTPTGISATCRRPIRGAAGRPLKESDFWLNESLLQRRNFAESSVFYSESHAPLPGASHLSYSLAPSGGWKRELRFLPMWLQLLLLSVVAGFLIFVYQTMETNELSPSGQSLSP